MLPTIEISEALKTIIDGNADLIANNIVGILPDSIENDRTDAFYGIEIVSFTQEYPTSMLYEANVIIRAFTKMRIDLTGSLHHTVMDGCFTEIKNLTTNSMNALMTNVQINGIEGIELEPIPKMDEQFRMQSIGFVLHSQVI